MSWILGATTAIKSCICLVIKERTKLPYRHLSKSNFSLRWYAQSPSSCVSNPQSSIDEGKGGHVVVVCSCQYPHCNSD